MAWTLTAILALYDIAMLSLMGEVGLLPLTITVLLAAFAALISFGAWVERRTVVRVDPAGVVYDSGIRQTQMRWNDIREVQVRRRGQGYAVAVVGNSSHFRFVTEAPVGMRGLKGESPTTGFPEGEQLASTIVKRAGLPLTHASSEGRIYRRQQ